MTPKTLADYLARKSRLGGTDDRFLWSVGMGVPPAKLDEKARFVGRAILPADSLSAGPTACKAGCFFDPVKTRQTMVTDDKRRSSVLLLIAGLRFRREHIAFTAARVDPTRPASGT